MEDDDGEPLSNNGDANNQRDAGIEEEDEETPTVETLETNDQEDAGIEEKLVGMLKNPFASIGFGPQKEKLFIPFSNDLGTGRYIDMVNDTLSGPD